MALVLENGSGLNSEANTYALVETLKGYAKARSDKSLEGKSPSECEGFLIQAMDYMRGLDYIGDRYLRSQPLDWPRYNVTIDNFTYSPQEMPRYVEQAQCAIALEIAKGVDVLPTRTHDAPGRVMEETVGPITTIYENEGRVLPVAAIAKADVLLRKIMRRNGLQVIRS
jgi:hypothetical protein